MSESDLPAPGRDSNGIALLKELGLRPGSADSVQDELTQLLLKAIDAHDLPLVKRIVEHGADVNAHYCDHGIWCSGQQFVTPLMAAADTSPSLPIVEYLLSVGADPTDRRELREDVGYSDYKWEGTGRYERAGDLTSEPAVRALLAAAAAASEAKRGG